MTTPTDAADERERLIYLMNQLYQTHHCCDPCKPVADMLRADAETIRQLKEGLFQMQNAAIDLTKQLAAQSAELERVRKLLQRVLHIGLDEGQSYSSQEKRAAVLATDISKALATPSAAGGEKEG